MTPERWSQIREIFAAALETPAAERARFLESACGRDRDLRAEVEAALAASDDPSWPSPAGLALATAPELNPGDTFSHYRVESKLGEGGMGVVFRAADTKLHREVALKVVAREFAEDPAWRSRFQREARVLASLNHPNIAVIYGLEESGGQCAIAMELVEGFSLAERMAKGRIPVPEALAMARQIAEALEYAHEAGIVHRDLKPANVKLRHDGVVKVLDFGLAKSVDSKESAVETATGTGGVMGTPAYMAPEQAAGKHVDRRADIWSFGVLLFEMLSGRQVYARESTVETLAAVARDDPPWKELPAETPSVVVRSLQRCLDRNPKTRLRDIGEARIAIEKPEELAPTAPDTAPRGRRRFLAPALVSSVALSAVAAAALYLTRPRGLDLSSYKFMPVATDVEPEDHSSWSPDGKSIAYLKNFDGFDQVMVRNLDSPVPTQLTRLATGVYDSAPFFSQDSEQVYFIVRTGMDTALAGVAVVGGEPREVLSFHAPDHLMAATLSPDGKTLAFWQVYVEGGKRYRGVFISSPPGAPPRKYQPAPFRSAGAYIPNFLRFSPDGSRIVLSTPRSPSDEGGGTWDLPWPDGSNVHPRRLFDKDFPGAFDFSWMADSRHICLSDGDLHLADTRTGKHRQITASATRSVGAPSVSPDGKKIVFTERIEDLDIVEVPLDGTPPHPLIATARAEKSPSWSAAGDQMAFITLRTGDSEIWLRSPDGRWERPLVRQSDFQDKPAEFESVALSPDGTRVAYLRSGRLWVSPVSGGKASEVVTDGNLAFGGPSWSPDGSSLAYMVTVGGVYSLAVARVGSHQPLVLVPGAHCGSAPVWSPDGRWIACGGAAETVMLVSPDEAQKRSLPSPVASWYDRVVLVWSREAATLYVASSRAERSRLDAIDVRSGQIRKIAEYSRDIVFSDANAYTLAGSLSRDGKSFATTVFTRKAGLWMLEGFPQPTRSWF